jgi:DNA-binding CsgD family transcriptional regulator
VQFGLEYKEIAREMGISPNTVKKYLVKAKAWLRVNGA